MSMSDLARAVTDLATVLEYNDRKWVRSAARWTVSTGVLSVAVFVASLYV